jgi:hypothetical protein
MPFAGFNRSRRCPFTNLRNSKKGHWGEGITTAQMIDYVWLEPRRGCGDKVHRVDGRRCVATPAVCGDRNDKAPEEVTKRN